MNTQLNLSQDEVDFINTILFYISHDELKSMGYGKKFVTNAKELAKKISMQAHGYDRNALGGGWLD